MEKEQDVDNMETGALHGGLQMQRSFSNPREKSQIHGGLQKKPQIHGGFIRPEGSENETPTDNYLLPSKVVSK